MSGPAPVPNCIDNPKEVPRKRILLADDNAEVMTCEEEMLSADYEIVAKISDGNTTCAEVARLVPDIVVLDISMGECNGIDIAHQLQQQGFGGSIVFLTIHEDLEFVTAAMGAGGHGYVVKSRMSPDLQLAVKAVLSGRLFISPLLQQS